jgi:hypothetical protein
VGDAVIAAELGTTEWILASVVVALVVTIAVLAWAETVIGRTTRARAAAMVDRQGRRAERVLRLATNPKRFVNVMLLLTLMLQLIEATLVGVLGTRLFGPLGLSRRHGAQRRRRLCPRRGRPEDLGARSSRLGDPGSAARRISGGHPTAALAVVSADPADQRPPARQGTPSRAVFLRRGDRALCHRPGRGGCHR